MLRIPNYRNLLNRNHLLNRGLVSEWVVLPGLAGGKYLYDIAGLNVGILTNGPTWQPTARPGGFGSLGFDNTNDYVEVPGMSSVVLTDSPGFAISGWLRPNTIDSNWHTILTKVNSASSNRQIFIGINGGFSATTNGLSLFTGFAGDGAVGTSALTANRWYFFHASHLGTGAGGNALWIWSVEGGWEAAVPGSVNPNTTGIDADAGTNNFRFGRYTDSSILPLSGSLDGLLFWSSAKHSIDHAKAIHAEQIAGNPNRWNYLSLDKINGASLPLVTRNLLLRNALGRQLILRYEA